MTGAKRYSTVAIVLHWLIAAMILANVILGGRMEDARGLEKFELYQLHKSIGLSILILTLARLGWRLGNPAPALPETMKPWERRVARSVQVGFYVLLIGVPIGGWAAVSASPVPIPTELWGVVPWFDLPVERSRETFKEIAEMHELGVKAIYVLLALHVLGALKHHFVDRDAVLWSMAPIFKRPEGK